MRLAGRTQISKYRPAQLELDRKFNFKTSLFTSFFDLDTPSAVKTRFCEIQFSPLLPSEIWCSNAQFLLFRLNVQ